MERIMVMYWKILGLLPKHINDFFLNKEEGLGPAQ